VLVFSSFVKAVLKQPQSRRFATTDVFKPREAFGLRTVHRRFSPRVIDHQYFQRIKKESAYVSGMRSLGVEFSSTSTS
jgi:hypothetical protein